MSSVLSSLVDWSWSRLPRLAARIAPGAGRVLADGVYVCAVPPAGALLPILAWAAGALLGWIRVGPEVAGDPFSGSLLLMAIVLLAGVTGTSLGARVVVGYALAHFTTHHGGLHAGSRSAMAAVLHVHLPLLLSYALLWLLAVSIPMFAGQLRATSTRAKLLRAVRVPLGIVLQGGLLAGGVSAWTHAVPTLIRPYYTWQDVTPPVPAMSALQDHGERLVILAAVLGAMRVVAEYLASRRPALVARVKALRTELSAHAGKPLVWWIRAPLRAILLGFVLSGTIAGWSEAAVLVIALAALLVGRELFVRYLPRVARAIDRVPLLFRLLFGSLWAYIIGLKVVGAMWHQTSTFMPIVWSTLISVALFAILIPPPRPQPPTPQPKPPRAPPPPAPPAPHPQSPPLPPPPPREPTP